MNLVLCAMVCAAFGAASPAGPRVAKVENGGLLFTDNPVGVSGTDCGYSVAMGDRALWLFGDCFLLQPTDPDRRYVGGVSNCGLLVPRGTGPELLRRYRFLTDPKTGLARQLIPNESNEGVETRLWAGGSWYDASKRRLWLYYARIRTTGGGGPFDFKLLGHGLAVADDLNPEKLTFRRIRTPNGSEMWWPHPGPVFGAAVVTGVPEADPYLYVVGVAENAAKKTGKLARVPKARIDDPAAYEYLSGSGPMWSSVPTDARDIEGLADFPSELSVAYNRYLGGYLAVNSVGISERIRISLACQPWGPYRVIGEIGAPHQAFEQAFCYAGKEHPEIAEGGGRVIYVTYVDSRRYWLQLLKVTLER